MPRSLLAFGSGAVLAAALVTTATLAPRSVPPPGAPWTAGMRVVVSPDPAVVEARRLALAQVSDDPPEPTENWLGEEAEGEQKARRKAWFREFHTAGDDSVDYVGIEHDNGLAQQARRNRLAALPPPPDGSPAWVERGSDNNAGRMHVAVHSTDGTQLYGGSSRGGIWRRPLDGGPWEQLADNLYGGAHHLVLFPAPDGGADIMLAATDGGGINRSDDDGETWVRPSGLPTTQRVRRLIRHPADDQTAWMVSGRWNNGWTHELLRTTDGGASFETLAELGADQPDLWVARFGADATLWLADDAAIFRSTDGGERFDKVIDLPRSDLDRLELTGSEAGAPRLWIVASGPNGVRELYRYDVGDGAAVEIDTPDLDPDDGRDDELDDYWGTLNASQVDVDLFAWGGVEVFYTPDGGANFARMNRWGRYYQDPEIYLHADNPGMDVWSDQGEEVWYFSTDGGLYESRGSIENVRNLSLDGLRVGQYYDVHTSRVDPSHVAAGAQDQGYQTTQRYEEPQEGVFHFQQILSGDYGHLTSSDGSHGVVYSVYPGFMLVALGETEAELVRPYVRFPTGESFGWLPMVVADPEDPWVVFFCGERLWRYEYSEADETWVRESWADRSFKSQDGEYISAITFSPVDPSRMYLTTNRGRFFTSDDKGRTFEQGNAPALSGHYFYGHTLIASLEDRDTAYVGGSGYQTPGVLRTTDGGRSWQAWDEGLPQTHVYALIEAEDGSGTVFAGTEQSAYVRVQGGQWLGITDSAAPITTYWSAEWLEEGTARFATYGRGVWDYRLDPDGDGCWTGKDADRDGYTCDVDCDDDDPLTHPDADDVCDGIDRNCDPTDFDEADADGDGFYACEECDDLRADVFPGAEEIRGNDVDEDCDGKAKKRCGCATTGGGLAPMLVLLPALIGLRRRRS